MGIGNGMSLAVLAKAQGQLNDRLNAILEELQEISRLLREVADSPRVA